MNDLALGRADGDGLAEVERAEMRFQAPLKRVLPADWVPVAQHFMDILTKSKDK